jgi:hypothetical protein
LQFIIQAAMSGDFLQSLLDPLSIPQICRRLRKPGLKPDLCALKGLRHDAIILGQFSLLKKLFLVNSGNLRFRVEVNGGDP